MSSGKGGSGASKTYNHFGSIAARVRAGRTDILWAIELDGKVVWEGPLYRKNSPNPVVITIPGRGIARYYWGLPNQFAVDPVLTASGNDQGHAHPAYTGQSYIVFENFLFGQERSFANRLKVIASAIPEQSLIAGSAAELDGDGQANPYAVLAELATSERFGQGSPATNFKASSWQESADAALGQSGLTYVSTLLTQQKTLKQVADDLLVLCDGWLRADRESGACEAGFFPQPETINPNTLPLIDSSSIAAGENPSWESETWRDVKTSWVCIFTDKDKDYKSRPSRRYDDPRALAARSLRDPETLQRPDICRSRQAFDHAHRYGRRFAVPGSKGEIPVRRVKAENLKPGQHLRLDIDPEPGGAQLQQVCRLLSITRPQLSSVTLRVEIEPTLQPVAFTATIVPDIPPPPVAVPDVQFARFFEVPIGLVSGNYAVGVLACRPSGLVVDYLVYYDRNLSGAFPQIGGSRSYALRGKLNQGLAADFAGPVVVDLIDRLNREIIGQDPGDAAARDDALLMIVLKVAGNGQIQADGNGKAWIEISSCEAFVASAANQVSVTALRGRQGTLGRQFVAGDEVWFIRRDALTAVEHADFQKIAAEQAIAYFKLQPGTQGDQRPLEDCALWPFSFALNRDKPATVENKFLERRYLRSSFPATPPANVDLPFGWSTQRPGGAGAIWVIEGFKSIDTGHLIGSWSAPVRESGSIYFFNSVDPVSLGYAVEVNDVWVKTDADNKTFSWSGSAWIPRFAPILKHNGGIVYGLQTADGGNYDYVLVYGDRFQIWNGRDAEVPFEILGEPARVYIKDSFIRELAAGKITSGTIDSKEIILSGGVNGIIRSANYEPGLAGFIFRGDGSGELNDLTIRGRLAAGKIATEAAIYNRSDPGHEDSTFPAVLAQSNSTAVDVSSAFGPVITVNFYGWKTGSGYARDRFGRSDPVFLLQFNGVLDHYVSLWYRIDGGVWTYVNGTQQIEPLNGYGSTGTQGTLSLEGLDGSETITFGVRGTNSNGAFFDNGKPLIRGTLSVICFNF